MKGSNWDSFLQKPANSTTSEVGDIEILNRVI